MILTISGFFFCLVTFDFKTNYKFIVSGYRQRDREHEVDPRMTQSMISERIQRSQSPVDVSLALSEDSTITITELNNR